ncbi:Ser-Thr-rich glycosyl-phosphatidyl-inositol-anchored membrane family-domain-containing protein [Diaporthe sp. PMI_573]|nr:Ser-Thr-rich glycosyl-phosphatidyl-inositol-anchored membrane family-domain-containing protein [Diaporthaceae sp. PMI_573]
MQVTITAATLLAWVSAALAQTAGFDPITTPAKDESVAAGSTYTVKWDYSADYAGTVSIQLLQGADPTTLQLGAVVASGLDNSAGSYAWAVDAGLGADATYGLKITYDSNPEVFQYSFPFHISKAAASSSAAAPATTAPAAGVPANQANVESTIYSTELVTITSCAATVTDCPARSTVVSSTLKPITTGGAPAPSAPAPVASAPNNTPVPPQPQTTLTPAYPVGNATTPAGGAIGTVTLKTSSSVAAGTGSIPAPTATGSVPVTANGAGRVAAGSVALVAGVMAAVFAL